MGRRKIGLVNENNADEFINYINARIKTFTVDKVAELIQLIATAKKTQMKADISFSNEYSVFSHEPETLSEQHKQILTNIGEESFKEVNDLIETIHGLKTAFRNAQAQKKHKKKNKLTDHEKHVVEMQGYEYFHFKELRILCKENGIDLAEQLKSLHRSLSSDIKKTTKK